MTKFFKELIPKYAIIPLLCIVAVNTVAYFVSKLFIVNAEFYDFSLPIDDFIPF